MAVNKKILKYKEAVNKIKECRVRGLKVILSQGAFDMVHIGHLDYLRSAKKCGNILVVGVENNESIRFNKGEGRPANNLQERLEFLSEFLCIDFVFGFNDIPKYGKAGFDTYVRRFNKLNPNAVAVSSFDPNLKIKRDQLKTAGVELIIVNYTVRDSSTRLLKLIGFE